MFSNLDIQATIYLILVGSIVGNYVYAFTSSRRHAEGEDRNAAWKSAFERSFFQLWFALTVSAAILRRSHA